MPLSHMHLETLEFAIKIDIDCAGLTLAQRAEDFGNTDAIAMESSASLP